MMSDDDTDLIHVLDKEFSQIIRLNLEVLYEMLGIL